MAQLTVRGTVPDFRGTEFRLPVDNGEELARFWSRQRIDTKYTLLAGRPTVKVRGSMALRCKPRSRVAVVIETFDRKDGRRVRAVSVTPLAPR